MLDLATPPTPLAAREGTTERFDPISCLDERVRHHAPPAEPPAPGRYLQVSGPSRSLLIPLGSEPLRIGRGLSAELHLDEMSVSRRHALLLPGPSAVRVLDERSSNGTFVNGLRVQQAELEPGDRITIGRFELRYIEV